MRVAGIDCGAKFVKALILDNGNVLAKGVVLSGFDQKAAAQGALDEALKEAGISQKDVSHITATGTGKEEAVFAQSTFTEVGANARAINRIYPSVRTIIDVGAEAGRAIRINEQGKVSSTLPSTINARLELERSRRRWRGHWSSKSKTWVPCRSSPKNPCL